MPVISFPKGPNTQEEPETGEPIETGTVDSIANFYHCPECGSAAFFIYDDGEAQCVKCDTILANILVIDTDAVPEKERADAST